MRVLEIGCGPGVAARAISRMLTTGKIIAIDRSAKAIALAMAGSSAELATGRLEFRQSSVEGFALGPGEAPFDLAFAMRVGALDGRHPEGVHQVRVALRRLRSILNIVYKSTGSPDAICSSRSNPSGTLDSDSSCLALSRS